MNRLERLPLRVKVTLVFVVVMGLVLGGIGAFLYFRTKSNLDNAIRDALRTRSGTLVDSIHTSPRGGRRGLIEPGERYAQVLTATGLIVESRPQDARPLLSPAEARSAAVRSRFIERHERTRLLATPVRVGHRLLVAVVASSLADRESALEGLGATLAIGGPLALLLAAALGYAVAAAAIRPVDLMRRRASLIKAADSWARLPLPAADDEIRRLAVTLNEMLARLSEAASQQRTFVANASHELRTPMTRLRTELELAHRHARSPAAFRSATAAAIADADELARLADDLLALAGSSADAAPLRVQEIQVPELAGEVVEDVRAGAVEDGRPIDVSISPTLRFRADRQRLARALRNMVENAVVHGSGRITVGADSDGATNRLWVQDEGGPIPDEALARVFQRFERAGAPTDRPGSGLGLAILREIAEAHGGDARLTNERGGGVRCTIEFPVWHTPPS